VQQTTFRGELFKWKHSCCSFPSHRNTAPSAATLSIYLCIDQMTAFDAHPVPQSRTYLTVNPLHPTIRMGMTRAIIRYRNSKTKIKMEYNDYKFSPFIYYSCYRFDPPLGFLHFSPIGKRFGYFPCQFFSPVSASSKSFLSWAFPVSILRSISFISTLSWAFPASILRSISSLRWEFLTSK
jgi:hypothetical protein